MALETVDACLIGLSITKHYRLICSCRHLRRVSVSLSCRYRCLEVITMPVPHPSDNIRTWLSADETHHQVECVCLFSLTTLTGTILLAIRMVQHYI